MIKFLIFLLLELFFIIICLKAKLICVATCTRHKSQGVGIPENYLVLCKLTFHGLKIPMFYVCMWVFVTDCENNLPTYRLYCVKWNWNVSKCSNVTYFLCTWHFKSNTWVNIVSSFVLFMKSHFLRWYSQIAFDICLIDTFRQIYFSQRTNCNRNWSLLRD